MQSRRVRCSQGRVSLGARLLHLVQELAIGSEKSRSAGYERELRIRRQLGELLFEPARQGYIADILPRDVLANGLATARDQRIGQSSMLSTEQSQSIVLARVLNEDISRAVRRAVIHDDEFELYARLTEHAVHRRPQFAKTVVHTHDDGNCCFSHGSQICFLDIMNRSADIGIVESDEISDSVQMFTGLAHYPPADHSCPRSVYQIVETRPVVRAG